MGVFTADILFLPVFLMWGVLGARNLVCRLSDHEEPHPCLMERNVFYPGIPDFEPDVMTGGALPFAPGGRGSGAVCGERPCRYVGTEAVTVAETTISPIPIVP